MRYADALPEVGWLILDGRGGLVINDALGTDWRGVERIRRLTIIAAGNFVASKLKKFRSLQEIDFLESFVEDTEFFSLLRRLKTVRLVDSELADWASLEYGEVERLYIAGESVVEAVYHESDLIMRGAAKVLLGLDCIRGIERLEGARFEHFDTWGIDLWQEDEIRALREELGVR